MPAFTYKCPNCNSGLVFKPEKAEFACEYCVSAFSEAELLARGPKGDQTESQGDHSHDHDHGHERDEFSQHSALYSCNSCGAEVITDDTTAATFCVYCHNPVILAGRLSGDKTPHKVIPFVIDKNKVREHFLAWTSKKWFMEPSFTDDAQKQKLTGVYFPFWLVDSKVDASISATGRTLRVWRVGNTEYTETSVYDIARGGEIDFRDITLKAFNKPEGKMLSGIYPYDTSKIVDFSMPYLTGFLAEKRNVERDDATPEAQRLIKSSSESLLRSTASGYSSLSITSSSATPKEEDWKYALMPAWLMTYKFQGENYYFVMNGQTGKVAGRVPVSKKKLMILFGAITAGVTLLVSIGGALFW